MFQQTTPTDASPTNVEKVKHNIQNVIIYCIEVFTGQARDAGVLIVTFSFVLQETAEDVAQQTTPPVTLPAAAAAQVNKVKSRRNGYIHGNTCA